MSVKQIDGYQTTKLENHYFVTPCLLQSTLQIQFIRRKSNKKKQMLPKNKIKSYFVRAILIIFVPFFIER